jgi:2-polyprenyl-3-methyl-5-hydroxy-6-metoxy-1,4-benzoquinol methylase
MAHTHLDNLIEAVPDLPRRFILDVGAGRGAFLIHSAKRGIRASGIEYEADNIAVAHVEAERAGVSIDIIQGTAESMPYLDAQFTFANLSEVIEHVRSPEALLAEVCRVLKSGSLAYASVPSRFSWYDTHFHIPFVNWIPRGWSDAYISLWGRQKTHRNREENFQRLADMHYYTVREAMRLFRSAGFAAEDLRMHKLRSRFHNPLIRPFVLAAYCLLRPWYFRAFHFLLTKV